MDQKRPPSLPAPDDEPIHPRIGVPKGVALAMGAGLVGLFVGGAVVAFTAAIAAPAIRERLRKRGPTQTPQPPSEPTA